MKKRTYLLWMGVLLWNLGGGTSQAEEPLIEPANYWQEWFDEKIGSQAEMAPIIQNRKIQKKGRFQIAGPTAGMMYLQDFYEHWNLSLAGRYFFKETFGLELVRITKTANTPTASKQLVTKATGYNPVVQLSQLQMGSAVLWSPVYGKYAWGSSKIIHFDLYALAGLGLRFVDSQNKKTNEQFFLEVGLGTNQHWNSTFGLLFEGRFRFYSEERQTTNSIMDVSIQVGPSFLF